MTTTRAQLSRDFCHASTQARLRMVEQIMAVLGRTQPDPKWYRQSLMDMDYLELERFYHKMIEDLL